MFYFELDEVEEHYGAEFGINLKFKGLDMVRDAFMKSKEICKFVENLWLFKNSNDAIEAAFKMK